MATSNKNSRYISSLVSYINDTKPFHSKLTEVVEEYQFFDEMSVKFTESFASRTKINPAWLYSFYSSGSAINNRMPLKQLNFHLASVFSSNANTTAGTVKVGRDENTDLASVPYVYSKKAFDGVGIADLLVERQGNRDVLEPMIEGIDYFQSHGSFQFQVKQTTDANTNFVPSWNETRNDDVVWQASVITRRRANDNTKPTSALRQIKTLMLSIQALGLTPAATALLTPILALLNTTQNYTALRTAATNDGLSIPASLDGYDLVLFVDDRADQLSAGTIVIRNALVATLDSFLLTRDYEPLLQQLIADGETPPAGYAGWIGNDTATLKYVDEALTNLTPSLYFNLFSNHSTYQSGQAEYWPVTTPYFTITNVDATAAAVAGDSWRVVAADPDEPFYNVFSDQTGFVGSVTATVGGAVFSSTTITFTLTHIAQAPLNYTATIRNRNRVVFEETALLETWNIIKVNPIAYTRPTLLSTRYGHLRSPGGVVGEVALVGTSLPTGTIILTARADGQYFDLTSSVEPSYTGLVQVGVPFNDGRIAFTIVQGTACPFSLGDRFYIRITNSPAEVVDLDLGFGYDLDSYDNADLLYTASPTPKINFVFDTRFTDYNLASLNLTIGQTAVAGRKWRIRAIPNQTQPIATIKKDGSGPVESVDLQAATSGVAPDVALTAAPLYSMLGDANPAPDLRLYYATDFSVEYSDNDFTTTTVVGTVPVGGTFSSITHDLSFTLTPGSKPFIGVLSDDGVALLAVEGGDVFSFQVVNNPPTVELPIGLTSDTVARVVFHGDGFHEAPPANWTVQFSSSNDYTVSGILTEGTPGLQVPGGPVVGHLTGADSTMGASFNQLGIHFTLKTGAAGFDAGDKFVFTTFSRKPSYLVHGSATGWTEDAVVGEPYWNGHIGFTVEAPTAELFSTVRLTPTSPNVWSVGGGTITLERLRFDAHSVQYLLTPTPSSAPTGWMVTRSDIGVVGHLKASGTFTDAFVTLTSVGVAPVALTLEVTADDFTLWNAQDVIIVRPQDVARHPVANDFLLIDRRTTDKLALNLDFTSVATVPSLEALAPITIDENYIDTYTGSTGIPLSNTSPETAILTNWIPLIVNPWDSSTSIAEFSDAASIIEVRAAGSNELVGTIEPTTSNTAWPVEFVWDADFMTSYMPLNTQSNLVTYGSGFNDRMNIRISENVSFLVSGGVLTTDYLFNDAVPVSIDEYNLWNIVQRQQDSFNALIEDSPFGGFLAGYDNLPFDEETFGYDTGYPLVDAFLQAKQLAALASPTPEQATILSDNLALIDAFLVGGDLNATELVDFLGALYIDGETLASSGFGTPARGLGIEIETEQANTASASIQDAFVTIAADLGFGQGEQGLDVGGLDQTSVRRAIIYSGALPPVPTAPTLTSYAEFETPLAVEGGGMLAAQVFEINFQITAANKATIIAMPTPKVFVWLPTWAAPIQATVVTKLGVGKYSVSVPGITEAKFYLQPGP